MTASGLWRWALGLTIAGLLTVVPFVYYRATYAHAKRLREVEPGLLYRSGQLTTAGFAEAIENVRHPHRRQPSGRVCRPGRA